MDFIIDLMYYGMIEELVADGSLALDPRGVSASSIYVLGQATRHGTRGALMAELESTDEEALMAESLGSAPAAAPVEHDAAIRSSSAAWCCSKRRRRQSD